MSNELVFSNFKAFDKLVHLELVIHGIKAGVSRLTVEIKLPEDLAGEALHSGVRGWKLPFGIEHDLRAINRELTRETLSL